MASFFGKASTKTTTVSPDPRVASMLKGILEDARGIDDFDFINHEAATMTPEERASIQDYAQSGNLQAIGGALSPRLMQGIEQATKLNDVYENAATDNITANDVLKNSNALRNGIYNTVQQTAQSAGNVAGRLGSGAARAAARRGTTQLNARNALDPSLTNRAIDMGINNQRNTLAVADMQGNIASRNQALGMTGINANDQATRNQLAAGNIMQGYQNALNLNNQANHQGANDFIWNKIAQKQNILGNVSGMAGYKVIEKGDAVSQDRQLLGAGIAGLGIASKAGYLGNSASTLQNNLDTGKVSYDQLGDRSNQVDSIPAANGAPAIPIYAASNTNGSGFNWGNAWTGVTGALSGMVGG
ncbi:hypothetical protein [Enterobacter cloacae]|uniref:hypothetical protein n=1 Tax=Enterobacter cloacae TaxID=550 RepID=UPI002006B18C|nr:hypothetical protein [Enterobacter cloacae]MCK7383349.1 hypothetical protein [Enterobacter cloacae]